MAPARALAPEVAPVPTTTTVVVRSGSGGVGWKTAGVLVAGAAGLYAWKRWNGYSWDDIIYVTKSAFDDSVEALESSIDATSKAVAATRKALGEQVAVVEQQIRDTGEELELKIEREVGLARDDIATVKDQLDETDVALRDIQAKMATEGQLSELTELVVETSKTARHTSSDVRGLHSQLENVASDVTELKGMVSQQTVELRNWMQSQLEDAVENAFQSKSLASSPNTPPHDPHKGRRREVTDPLRG